MATGLGVDHDGAVVATSHLLGVSTRRMDRLVEMLGITSLSKSHVSRLAAELGEQVEAFRTRPLGGGLTRSCGPTRSPSRSARASGWSTCTA